MQLIVIQMNAQAIYSRGNPRVGLPCAMDMTWVVIKRPDSRG